MKTNLGTVAYILTLFLLAGGTALAQQAPVLAQAKQAILDEFGQPLSSGEGDLIQILAVNGAIHPPGPDGQPHVSNTLVFTARIGYGFVSGPEADGRFNATISPYPSGAVFARVFNAPTLEQASFYTDAQSFTPAKWTVYYPEVSATTNALDPDDDDGDGVNNSWEKSLGSDKSRRDSDGDGSEDGDEWRAGTDLADENSVLTMAQITPQTGGSLLASWEAVVGKSYQIQYVSHLGAGGVLFSNIHNVVTATGPIGSTVITNGMDFSSGFFRVRLVE